MRCRTKKICQAVRDYFEEYAVTADREVQIYRRKLSREAGGTPGSEVDVLVRVPAAGLVNADPIAVPIEVKLSNNPEARTGLRDQLVERYMRELGTSFGAFVVVWMTAPKMTRNLRPQWKDLADADAELKGQSNEVRGHESTVLVAAIVIDASLAAVPEGNATSQRRATEREGSAKATPTKARPGPHGAKKGAQHGGSRRDRSNRKRK